MSELYPSNEPFFLRKGDSRETAMYNRILAIERVNYLIRQEIPDFDIRSKTDKYRNDIDKIMNVLYFQTSPQEKISELFCQRLAKVCISLERGASIGDLVKVVEKTVEKKDSWLVWIVKKLGLWK